MDIKGVIKSHGYTLAEVAGQMGISKSGISQIVNGSPQIGTLRTIARIVGCNMTDFFADELPDNEKSLSPVIKCPHCGKKIKINFEPVKNE